MIQHRLILLAALVVSVAIAAAAAAQQAISRFDAEDRKSGYLFLGPATKALQDDDFLNPGMFAIERGRELWSRAQGPEGRSCASCHADAEASMRGVAARCPQVDATKGGLVNLELRINAERETRMKAAPLPYESEDLLAITAYISHQSRGEPMRVSVEGPARPFFEQGRQLYFERRGQLDLACNQCHEAREGAKLRGDVISQGQVNGFPIYRLMWQSMASRHRMLEWCNTSVRAEPYALGSAEYLALELFLAWRGRDLPIETPAVRR